MIPQGGSCPPVNIFPKTPSASRALLKQCLPGYLFLAPLLSALFGIGFLRAQATNPAPDPFNPPPFNIQSPDWDLSPFTGMTRQGWLECGKYILESAFQHVKSLEDPMLFPKVPGVSYPQEGYDACSPEKRTAAILEGVARTFNIAAPLLADDPGLTFHGIKVADYYKYHILRLTDPKSPDFIGWGNVNKGPIQQTCELGNLALWSLLLPDVFWNKLTDEEKDQVAHVMQGWSSGWTKTHNWRWFNVMMMTFLKTNGYPIDEQLMLNHIDHLLMLESGEGWFRDKSHDYYTAHVFQLYGSVWNRFYGRKNEPGRAREIDRQFLRFMKDYPEIFSRSGKINMWGRSILYRMGGSASLPAAFLRGGDPGIDAGFARRLASGALLQFITHPRFLENGVPSLGYYGHFEPAIQSYSCAASPFWMFMNFTALALPKEDPFWTARENEGFWPSLGKKSRASMLPGAGLLLVNHGSTGTSEILNAKAHNTDPSYCRLRYNTDFPWEANCTNGVTASEISLASPGSKNPELPEIVNFAGFRDGILYRQAIFKIDQNGGTPPFADMAEIVIPGGEISVIRFRKIAPSTLTSGYYGIPHLKGAASISERTVDGKKALLVAIPGRQLALLNYQGWDRIESEKHAGLNPEAENSTLPYLVRGDDARYGAPDLLISVMLHRTDDIPLTDDTLQPIRSVEPLSPGMPPAVGGVKITLKSGVSYDIDFRGIDGSSSR